jgi:diaminohydroxyphosphoribosylaminopyrimidine deaminase/5-amino-6-(5-phosphoribosylamino)uracil reductase
VSAKANDRAYMAHALQLAARGLTTTDPNPRVGCVIVAGDEVVGEGWHIRAGEAHAEAIALNQAGDRAAGSTVYVTLEPCCHEGRTPPCVDRLVQAKVRRVVYAANDPNPAVAGQGAERLRAAGVDMESGLMESESRLLNPGFFSRMIRNRPWVRSKLAVSVDGRTALANGASKWITGEAARSDVQRWRARSTAILTGAGTVIADDPSLNVRDPELSDARQPMRVIVDSRLRMSPNARVLSIPGDTVVLYCDASDKTVRELAHAGARVEKMPAANGRVALEAVMSWLSQMEVNELLVEAGPVLNGALIEAGLIDEYLLYIASHILGTDARGMFGISALQKMSDRVELQLIDVRHVGDDLRLRYQAAAE